VVAWFQREELVLVRTTKEEKYGRMLADCYREGEPSLCTELLERGLARPYNP
jgi:endonuclease YncB( thermonuclease family)